jgi:hypothetical protein
MNGHECPSPSDSDASDPLRQLLAAAIGPSDLDQLTDDALEALLDGTAAEPFTPEQTERLLERLNLELATAPSSDISPPSSAGIMPPPPVTDPFSWTTVLTGAALVVGLAVCTVIWLQGPSRPVGVLARQEACVWSPGQRPLAEGEPLGCGPLRLESGLVELRLGQGATLVLEGPAHLDVESGSRCFLHFGRAVVRVEEEARGFIVDGPQGRIVDLGTEFGVCVQQAGDMEVHVLEGRVTAQPVGTNKPVELTRSQAMQWSADKVHRLAAQPLSFVTDLPTRSRRPVGFVHWSFDEGTGTISRNLGHGLGRTLAAAHLRCLTPGRQGPEWTTGQFGTGLSFNGKTDFVECDFAGISGGNPRTIAFWVKVPRDIGLTESYGIVSWGTFFPGAAWQISVNPEETDGQLGALRAGIHQGTVVGTTDLRDDRWHHVAVVMYGGRRPDISTHVLLYVDGQLETTTNKAVREVRTDTSGQSARQVQLGRNIRDISPLEANDLGFFRGCLDEVFIFNAPLTQTQIQSLQRHNCLSTETHLTAGRLTPPHLAD